MFDHVTLRVPELELAAAALKAAIDELEIPQTTLSERYAIWGNLAVTEADENHPVTTRAHIALVALRVADVEAAAAFYSNIAPHAGLTIRRQTNDRAAFSVGHSGSSLILIGGEPTQNLHIAFSAEDAAARSFHQDAIAAGYKSNGEPGERPHYHEGYYAAFVTDPDGNNIEAVNHNR